MLLLPLSAYCTANYMVTLESKKMSNDRVASLNDLLARCIVANERTLSKSTCIQPEQIVRDLGLNFPGDTSNAELTGLLPLYTKLLKDICDNPETSPFLDILRKSSRDYCTDSYCHKIKSL